MKIIMLTSIAGADFSLSPRDGSERFSDDEAARLIDAGFAVPYVEPDDPMMELLARNAELEAEIAVLQANAANAGTKAEGKAAVKEKATKPDAPEVRG